MGMGEWIGRFEVSCSADKNIGLIHRYILIIVGIKEQEHVKRHFNVNAP